MERPFQTQGSYEQTQFETNKILTNPVLRESTGNETYGYPNVTYFIPFGFPNVTHRHKIFATSCPQERFPAQIRGAGPFDDSHGSSS